MRRGDLNIIRRTGIYSSLIHTRQNFANKISRLRLSQDSVKRWITLNNEVTLNVCLLLELNTSRLVCLMVMPLALSRVRVTTSFTHVY